VLGDAECPHTAVRDKTDPKVFDFEIAIADPAVAPEYELAYGAEAEQNNSHMDAPVIGLLLVPWDRYKSPNLDRKSSVGQRTLSHATTVTLLSGPNSG
jgi:hypothetical protein